MVQINSADIEREGVLAAVKMMAVAARTSPKTRGLDSLQTLILHGRDELEKLARAMEDYSTEDPTRLAFFKRNADDVRQAAAVLLLGVTGEPKRIESPLDCGACGMDCNGMANAKKKDRGTACGPMCHMQSIDLGIALGVAVKAASEMGIDNRIMYSIGATARKMKLMDANLVIGIPFSVTGKNPFFTGR
jgi:uncharacterized ferredoxin-like protein